MRLLLSKEKAWEPAANEQRINLDLKHYAYQFTRKWFIYRNLTSWSTFFPARFPADKPVKMLQIGVFEGMDLVWCFQNILKHPKSHVMAVDPWAATTKLDAEKMKAVMRRAHHNLRPYQDKLTMSCTESQRILPCLLPQEANSYDLIVIDGDHNAAPVLADAKNALKLAKPGGWLVFDDYHNDKPKRDHVQKGVSDFLDQHEAEVTYEWGHRYCVCFSKNKAA